MDYTTKIRVNLDEIPEDKRKGGRMVAFRLPEENYNKLKSYDKNVSNILRYLVELYLVEKANEEKVQRWTTK